MTARTGKSQVEEEKIFVYTTDETTRPSIEYAHCMSLQSLKPDMRMDVWIDSMIVKYPFAIAFNRIPSISEVKWKVKQHTPSPISASLRVKNGWIVRGDCVMTNGTYPKRKVPGTTGWQGNGSLSQFVPGRTGTGFTEEPDNIAEQLFTSGGHVLQHRSGLWYERRRNDHQSIFGTPYSIVDLFLHYASAIFLWSYSFLLFQIFD